MSDGPRVADPGLQPERTALAWRRTLLSFAVAFLAGSRILLDQVGPWSYAITAAGLSFVAVLALLTERRSRAAQRHLTGVDDASVSHDGAIMAGAAAVALLIGVAALLFVLGRLG